MNQTLSEQDWREVLPPRMKALHFSQYRFQIRMTERSHLVAHKGSLFRGGLMWEFRRLHCTKKRRICEDCPLLEECLYPAIFEPPKNKRERQLLERYTNAGAYLLQEPENYKSWYQKGERLSFGLVLVGRARYAFPQVLTALKELGRRGFGADDGDPRSRFVVERVWTPGPEGEQEIYNDSLSHPSQSGFFWSCADFADSLPEHPIPVRVEAVSPLRMRSKGKWEDGIACADLIHYILCRLRDLYRDHAMVAYPQRKDGPLEPYRHVLMEMAHEVEAVEGEPPPRLERRSRPSRRDPHPDRQRLDGWLGTVTFQNVPPPLVWLLRLAERLHMGKNLSFGCGRLRIVERPSEEEATMAETG